MQTLTIHISQQYTLYPGNVSRHSLGSSETLYGSLDSWTWSNCLTSKSESSPRKHSKTPSLSRPYLELNLHREGTQSDATEARKWLHHKSMINQLASKATSWARSASIYLYDCCPYIRRGAEQRSHSLHGNNERTHPLPSRSVSLLVRCYCLYITASHIALVNQV